MHDDEVLALYEVSRARLARLRSVQAQAQARARRRRLMEQPGREPVDGSDRADGGPSDEDRAPWLRAIDEVAKLLEGGPIEAGARLNRTEDKAIGA